MTGRERIADPVAAVIGDEFGRLDVERLDDAGDVRGLLLLRVSLLGMRDAPACDADHIRRRGFTIIVYSPVNGDM